MERERERERGGVGLCPLENFRINCLLGKLPGHVTEYGMAHWQSGLWLRTSGVDRRQDAPRVPPVELAVAFVPSELALYSGMAALASHLRLLRAAASGFPELHRSRVNVVAAQQEGVGGSYFLDGIKGRVFKSWVPKLGF